MTTLHRTKIVFLITKSTWGGAGRYVYDLATNLPKNQFDVAVALGGIGVLREKLRDAGITVLGLQNLQRDLSISTDIGGFFSIYKVLRSSRPDIVHLNSSKAGGLGALAARLLGIRRIVFTVHGWPFVEKRNWLWRIAAFIGSWFTSLLSHAIIVISKYDLRIGAQLPFCGRKMHLIYNGIALPMQFGSGEQIRAAFPPGVHITGTIGELTRNKNQQVLVEKARSDPNLYVAIVGEGEERSRLEEKIRGYGISDRVKLFGFIPVNNVLRGFDTFALPSLKEGLPYVLLEARAAGLPIVASRVGGVADIVDAPDLGKFSLDAMVANTIELYRS